MSNAPRVNSESSLVLIAAGGRGASEQAEKFRHYHCQNRRSFRRCRYIAFYAKQSIEVYAEIDGAPEDDVIMSARLELSGLAEHTRRHNGNPDDPHSPYRLKNVSRIGPIINDKLDRNGDITAFIQKHTYTSIDKLLVAKLTSELV